MRNVCCLALLLGAVLAAGCSSGDRVGVQGMVKYDGEPIAIGTITFLPTEGKGVKCGGRIENGRYTVEPRFGPTPGLHRVEIHWARPTGRKYKNEFGEVFDVTEEGLPDKYYKNSTLTATIEPRANVIDFSLER
jgi:hypothetical protein